MLWICPNGSVHHKHVNLGRYKTCQSCGRPKTDKEEFIMPDDISVRANITDESLLRKAHLSEDLHCSFCGASRFADQQICLECGASQTSADDETQIQKDYNNITTQKKEHYSIKETKKDRNNDYAEQVSELEQRSTAQFQHKSKLPWIIGSSVFVLFVGLFVAACPHHEPAKVSAVEWTYTVNIEKFHAIHDEGWSTPANAEDVQQLGSRIHHYVKVPNGTRHDWVTDGIRCGQSCYTTPRTCQKTPKTCSTVPRTCTSNKNGFASCTGGNTVCTGGGEYCTGGSTICSPKMCLVEVQDYKDEPVMQTWYSWNVWRWDYTRNVQTSGNSIETWWPNDDKLALRANLLPREDERISQKIEHYSVTLVSNSGRVLKYMPNSKSEFTSLNIGTERLLRVSLFSIDLVK